MNERASPAVQDYLKAVYELCREHGRASTGQIAGELEVTPASVTGMLKKLAAYDPPLLAYRKHRGAELTPDGERIALEVIRRHRLLESYLHDALGYSWDEVHEEAERLEHVISGTFGERIAHYLGEPRRDPHGHPIPTPDLRLPDSSHVKLSELAPGQGARIARVSDRDPKLLRYLARLELMPGTELTVLDPPPLSDDVCVRRDDGAEPVVISGTVAEQIYVSTLSQRGAEA